MYLRTSLVLVGPELPPVLVLGLIVVVDIDVIGGVGFGSPKSRCDVKVRRYLGFIQEGASAAEGSGGCWSSIDPGRLWICSSLLSKNCSSPGPCSASSGIIDGCVCDLVNESGDSSEIGDDLE